MSASSSGRARASAAPSAGLWRSAAAASSPSRATAIALPRLLPSWANAVPAGSTGCTRPTSRFPRTCSFSRRNALAHYGAVDLLVVSVVAVGYEGLPPATRDLPLAAWQQAIDVNLHGPFLANRAFLPMMMASGEGDILNICSSTTPRGLRGTALAPGYSASKFAVAAFTRSLAEEAAEYGVRVNALFPGPVEAPLIAGTALARPFGGSMTPDSFAEAVIELLRMDGAAMPDPHILPLPRRRGTAARSGGAA